MPSYGIQTKYWSTPKQSQFLVRQIPLNKRDLIGETNTKITVAFSSFLRTSFRLILRTISMRLCCVLIGQKLIHYQFPHWGHGCLETSDWGGFLIFLPVDRASYVFFNCNPLHEFFKSAFCHIYLYVACLLWASMRWSSFAWWDGPEKATPNSWRWCLRRGRIECSFVMEMLNFPFDHSRIHSDC